VAAAGLPIGAVDLEDDLACCVQEASQRGAIGASAFHAPGLDLTEPVGPGEQVLVAAGGGGDPDGVDTTAELVVGVGDVEVQVGVDPDGDPPGCGLCDAGDGRLLSIAGGWHARRPGRQHCDGSGDRLVSGHVRPG
jgi:hypothetical protein